MTKRIGIYGPYFGIMGGGELYLGTIAEVLSRNHEVDLISESEIPIPAFQKFFGLDLSRVKVRLIPEIPFVESMNPFRRSRYFRETLFTKDYDVFILMPRNFRIPFRTLSKKSILHLQVPDRPWSGSDYWKRIRKGRWSEVRNEIIKSVLYPKRYAQYDAVLINSNFHERIISGRLRNPHAIVLPPPVNLRTSRALSEKEPIILSVARFFRGLHSKRQDVLISAFRLFSADMPGWKLILAGGLSDEAEVHDYFEELRVSAKGLPIEFLTNVPASELDELFSRAKFFWHAAGYGVGESEPEKMEHFGISTVEAMSAGCLPLVYRAGGQEEIIQERVNGVFWKTEAELVERTKALTQNDAESAALSAAAIQRSREYGKDRFAARLMMLVSNL